VKALNVNNDMRHQLVDKLAIVKASEAPVKLDL